MLNVQEKKNIMDNSLYLFNSALILKELHGKELYTWKRIRLFQSLYDLSWKCWHNIWFWILQIAQFSQLSIRKNITKQAFRSKNYYPCRKWWLNAAEAMLMAFLSQFWSTIKLTSRNNVQYFPVCYLSSAIN